MSYLILYNLAEGESEQTHEEEGLDFHPKVAVRYRQSLWQGDPVGDKIYYYASEEEARQKWPQADFDADLGALEASYSISFDSYTVGVEELEEIEDSP